MATTKVKDPAAELHRLESRLVLHDWVVRRALGYKTTKEMLEDLAGVDEGFDGEGRSGVLRGLRARENRLGIPVADLERYDQNVRDHLREINASRAEPIVLKYFQHLAALFTEIFLDNRFDRPDWFIAELNEYAESREGETIRFAEGDLDRLAFMMATGSGKTLLMHLNYRQFLHYNDGKTIDNILLITPNERLTAQHLEEMRLSGIECERFEPDGDAGFGDVVRATEISKLTEEKKGGGVRVDVEAFEGRNLVFVDEGHKGATAEVTGKKESSWLNLRRRIAEGGFTFEYSATFTQALAKAKKTEENDLLSSYGRSILFDYSYRYFYGDGYGKDFRLLNIKESSDENTDFLLAGNLLSFYEQKLRYEELGDDADAYNLKDPLWTLLGLRVEGNTEQRSDIYNVLSFLHRFVSDRGWGEAVISRVLEDEDGPFAEYFPGVKATSPGVLYRDVLRLVFRAVGSGGLVARSIRGSDGQMGLGVSGSEERSFGLVYVGEPEKLRKLIEERDEGIALEEDVIGGGLFAGIDGVDSPVNVLVGARKFVEGWSSWRVSSMGLINVGNGEGPMIIQLFGRGVRLQGRDFSLKRSAALDGEHPEKVAPVETLGVFGLKANYMDTFRKTLALEDVDPDGYVTLPPLDIHTDESFLNSGLLIPRPPDEEFADNESIFLDYDENVKVSLDLSLRFETGRMSQSDGRFDSASSKTGAETQIEEKHLDLLDWSDIYHELLEFKSGKGFRNLIIPPDTPKDLMRNNFYKLICNESVASPRSFEGLKRLQGVVVSLLGKYIEKHYHQHQQRWDSERITLEPLTEAHGNLAFGGYKVMVKREQEDIREAVEGLIGQAKDIYDSESETLPRLHFDRHIYQPLLLKGDDTIKSAPVGLEPSERIFIESLREHCRENSDEAEVFLLRNLSKGKGVGFFRTAGFYPDFIVWVKWGEKQRIVFVEPHGMRNDDAPDHNDKVQLYKQLREISLTPGFEDVELDSFIISATPFDVLAKLRDGTWTRDHFADNHILFEDDLEERMPMVLYGAKEITPAR